ncbi:uncharacterized protein LOC127872401 [Dreissena polymorpha]|uniref:uncharacterized protein LOC127872401 n=1 Tax=Dreissena polymorpha TaxID=45954 RepID=UPI002263ABCC|nr:uncharacterized protein LOC127872401 [Dreissena polymorpha]
MARMNINERNFSSRLVIKTSNVSHYRVSVGNVTNNSNLSEWPNERLCNETQGDDPPFPSSGTHAVLGVFCKKPVVGNTIRIQLLSTHTQLVLCDVYASQACRDGTFGKDCKQNCFHCADNTACDKIHGSCTRGCKPGYTGPKCDLE